MDVANADGNKVASCTTMADVASRGMLISLGGRSRIRVLSEGGDSSAKEVPSPEVYALVQAEVIRSGRVTLTRDGLDALCSEVGKYVNIDMCKLLLSKLFSHRVVAKQCSHRAQGTGQASITGRENSQLTCYLTTVVHY